jgi:transcriptional regulator with XRE-family HTH domain
VSEVRSHQVPTGEALEKARRRVGFTAVAASEALGIPVRALGDFESGLRTPSDAVVEAMLALYGIELGRITSRSWVPRVPPRYDSDTQTLWLGWSAIHITEKANDQILCSVAAALRSMRSLAHDAPLQVRATDLPLLAQVLDLTDENLPDTFMRYFRLSPSDCLCLVNEMVVLVSAEN